MTAKEFDSIYRRLYLPLCMYALRMTEDTQTAGDVVQTAFMNTWERIKGGQHLSAPEMYMYRTVRNAALALLKSESKYLSLDEMNEEVTDEDIDMAERDARLWKAIDDMPPRRREIFLLSKRDGLTYKEIAGELNLSIKTVENQISKALASLKTESKNIFFLLSFL